MLPAKFQQIYFRLVWKGDTSPQSYQKILLEFSKLKGKGICVPLRYKKIYVRWIYFMNVHR